ncbi:substrate-binding domain-containing protein [Sneathiella chinensis]|nr:substrate-binding domain-containing protein [Sneathiella chinensis]
MLFFCLVLSVPAFGQSRFEDYWTIDEFFRKKPAQKQITAAFEKRVQKSGNVDVPLPDRTLRISVVYPGVQASDYWTRSVRAFEARLKELGVKYTLMPYFTRPSKDVGMQRSYLAKALNSKADYLVFTLNAERHKGLIQKFMAAGPTKVFLQNITTPLKAFGNRQPFQYVGFDHIAGTRLLAERYLTETGGEATYAMLYGPEGYVSAMRGDSFYLFMDEHPKMKRAAAYYVGFDREKARAAALELLTAYPDLDFIYSASTDIALGVVDALKETGKLGQVLTNGWGGGAAELAALEAGELPFTVMRMNDDNGVAMAEAVFLDQTGRRAAVPLVYSGELVLVDQKSGSKRLMELKERAFRYSK